MDAFIYSFAYSLIMRLFVYQIFPELLCARLRMGFGTQLPPAQAARMQPGIRNSDREGLPSASAPTASLAL